MYNGLHQYRVFVTGKGGGVWQLLTPRDRVGFIYEVTRIESWSQGYYVGCVGL